MDQEPTGSKSKADNTGKSVAASSSDSLQKPSDADVDEEEETRVITLDTIIRKGLVEQMPMTAKDINSIVAISMQKEREKQAADRLRLAALKPRNTDYDEDDDTDSSDYDSSNDNECESNLASTVQYAGNMALEITKEPPSVIQRAPKDTKSYLADDLKSTQDDVEDFELKSGDLHYSESNPSDYSESENRLSSSQSSLKKRLTLSRKRDLSPIVEPSSANKNNEESIKKQRVDLSTSCTDSKRNAILLQCSSGFGSSANESSPKLSLVDEVSQKSLSPNLNLDTNESSEHSRDRSLDIESMLLVQHSMEDDTTVHDGLTTDSEFKPIAVKIERESPAENMLEIHHVEDYLPDVRLTQQNKIGRGGRKSKSQFNRSTYSEQNTPTKSTPTKRTKKTKTTPKVVSTILVQPESISPISKSAPSSSGAPRQRHSQKRDKRQTVRSNPVYAELSESSCDNLDIVAASKSATVTAPTDPLILPTSSTTPKMHWKTQLKMQRKKSDPLKLDKPSSSNLSVKPKQTSKPALNSVDEPLIDNNDKLKAPEIETNHEPLEEVTVVNKIIEPPHHQKRIPKLKYGSFNFTERRGVLSKGPKMVLKYKKKYKKKSKSYGSGFVSAGEEPAALEEVTVAEVRYDLNLFNHHSG